MADSLISRLELNEEFIARDLEVNYSLAQIYDAPANLGERFSSRPQEDWFLRAATHYRRAGAQALLLADKNNTDSAFYGVTRNFDRLGLPYGNLVMGITSQRHMHLGQHAERALFEENRNLPWYAASARRQRVYPLLGFAASPGRARDLFEPLRRIRLELETERAYPMGVLGTPLGDLLDLVDVLAPGLIGTEIQPEDALTTIIHRYISSLRIARRNHHHWIHMTMPFHPAEPDVFAVFGMIGDALREQFALDLLDFFEAQRLPEPEKSILIEIYRRLPETAFRF